MKKFTSGEACARLWEDSVIDCFRYPSCEDCILGRTPGCEGEAETMFCDSDRLREAGVNVTKLAICLQEGWLKPDQIASLLADGRNGNIDELNNMSAGAFAQHMPDALDVELFGKALVEGWILWPDVGSLLFERDKGIDQIAQVNEALLHLEEIHTSGLHSVHEALMALGRTDG